MLATLVAMLALAQEAPRFPPHYAGRATTCPVGGEKFDAPALMHYSTFGALPDGQPIGSIGFPILLAECPGNGLVIFDEFTPEQVAKLGPLVASDAYKALRGAESSYYRASWLADALGDKKQAAWLLLSATWEAKNTDPASERARRYNAAFAAAATAVPADAKDFQSIALRARAANALRELGQFDEAEALRAGIVVAPDAGGDGEDAPKNREGWSGYLKKLAGPIARKDPARLPIDMMADRDVTFRCLGQEYAARHKQPAPPPLTAFETEYCARPELAADLAEHRKKLAAE
ncbi:hypothetical protein OK349_08825 [Sphingomonas sp. BT-65]|uniref:hypothetical protein n=1 Tax=Sphingomonas sp. BT-65 TaxID=2989821 RepID=UPI002235D583|nr:hypothetical protein [Sphingomonas sp. BT-65]MCW4461812.1 hypothetical protein [Sphingomonas sp. BT-65]